MPVELAQLRCLGSYTAKSCPVAIQLDFDDSVSDEMKAEDPALRKHQAEEGRRFEAEVFATLQEFFGTRIYHVAERDMRDAEARKAMQDETVAALASNVDLVLGAYLPNDELHRRSARPDILMRHEGGWLPVDVKHHRVIEEARSASSTMVSSLAEPWFEAAEAISAFRFNTTNGKDDALQLSHYRRVLEVQSLASNSTYAAILDSSKQLWWIDLAEVRWDSTPTLAIYDQEFADRVEVALNQCRRNVGEDASPALPALRRGSCVKCSWHEVCSADRRDRDCVSLVPNMQFKYVEVLRGVGIATQAELAKVDYRSAALLCSDAKVKDFAETIQRLQELSPETRLDEGDAVDLLGKEAKLKVERLASLGFALAGDLDDLDDRLLMISSKAVGNLPAAIDAARSAAAGQPLLKRGVEQLTVPRANIEIDFDMENAFDGSTYLWGAMLSCSSPIEGLEEGYRPFVRFVEPSPQSEAEILRELWEFFRNTREIAEELGRSFKVYCYNQSAEKGKIQRVLNSGLLSEGEVDCWVELMGNGEVWIDLRKVVSSQLVIGSGERLKEVARIAGADWDDEEAGGDNSMLWFRDLLSSTDQQEIEGLKQRLLTYNRNDCEATMKLRDWLTEETFRSVEDWNQVMEAM